MMAEIQVFVEFTGISRMLTGQSDVTFKIDAGTTFKDIVALVAKQYPALLGQIIDMNGRDFIATNLFSLNGQQMIQDSDMGGKPQSGDRLILISLLAGG